MSDQPEPFEKFVGGWMRVVSNQIHTSFAEALSQHDITPAGWAVMRIVQQRGPAVSPSEIARYTGLTRGAVSKLVDRAVSQTLLVQAAASGDRRFREIRLTAKGRRLVPKLARLAKATDDRHLSCLTEPERRSLSRLLIKLATANRAVDVPTA